MGETSNYQDKQCYDIIGDVHGYHLELQKLLIKLDYTLINGVWTHMHRIAVFVGDFIIKGPNSRGVIRIIKDMVNAGTAFAILGNHEINVIMYFTYNNDGSPINTPHNNISLLEQFSSEYIENQDALIRDVKWLRTLPLYLDLKELRVVHAYWNDEHILKLNHLYKNGRLRKKRLKEIIDPKSPLHRATMQTIKGIELPQIQNGIVHRNNRRNRHKIKWWKKKNYKRALRSNPYFSFTTGLNLKELASNYTSYPMNAPPLFIGHYNIESDNFILAPNICCVDVSITKKGRLAAYRFSREEKLDENNLVVV